MRAKPGDALDGLADARVALVVVVLRPGVEAPVHERDLAVVADARRSGAESRSHTRSFGTTCNR